MRKTVLSNPKEIIYVPTTHRELYWLAAHLGISVNIIKWNGGLSLIYTNEGKEHKQVNACKTIDGMTFKGWANFITKNKPEEHAKRESIDMYGTGKKLTLCAY